VSVSELKRMKELEAENAKLKRMYAELALENATIKDLLSRKREATDGRGVREGTQVIDRHALRNVLYVKDAACRERLRKRVPSPGSRLPDNMVE
jgi:hypothetical protein